MREKIACIYKLVNIVHGKFYIGASRDFKNRKSGHISRLRRNIHDNSILQRSFNKHGEENFEFHILEYVDNVQDLPIREQYYIDTLDPHYNLVRNVANDPRMTSHEGYIDIPRRKVIIQYDLEGNFIKEWDWLQTIVQELGLKPCGIGQSCTGYQKQSQGFIWKYKDEFNAYRGSHGIRKFTDEELTECLRDRNAENFLVTFPDGKTEKVRNIAKFCRDNNLKKGSLRKCYVEKVKNKLGWKVEKLED